jgi:hypothetical protein
MKISPEDIQKLNSLEWAKRNRVMWVDGKKEMFSISKPPYVYPFLKDIYYSRCIGGPKHLVAMKPRQVGLTELAINTALYAIDQFTANTIYLLPGQKELRGFAGARVNEIIRNSPRIGELFSNIDNLDLKAGKAASLYFRGTNSAAGLEEVPADYVIRDEIDQMNQENAAMILEALGGSFLKWVLDLSHPTYPGKGIHAVFKDSSQHRWMFICPHCGAKQEVTWEGNVDIENHQFVCSQCYKWVTKDDLCGGFYEPLFPQNPVRGFHFTQLLSPTVDLSEQIIKWNKAQGIPYKVRIFYNTVLGLPYAETSKKLTEEDVRKIMTAPSMPYSAPESVMGLDVGSGLHLWVESGNTVLNFSVLDGWDELDSYIKRYNPACVVIDAGPEGHKAMEVCSKLRANGIDAWVCMRSDGLKGNRVIDDNIMMIKINKTEQFDEFYARLLSMSLPSNTPQEVVYHLVEPVRTYRTNTDGSKVGVWEKGISHFADAGSYAMEAAKQLETRHHVPTNIVVPNLESVSRWRGRIGEYGE